MTFAILPVKDPARAKQRLAGIFSPQQREALARFMFEQMLATLLSARGPDRVAVATSDRAAAAHARAAGALVFEETEQRGHSHSADRAAERAIELGATRVLLAPIDTPLATAAELEGLLDPPFEGMVIVPSADGTGTNALVRTPPNALASYFGPNSFYAHVAHARTRRLPVRIAEPPGLVFDLDTPEDVDWLLAHAPGCPAARWIRTQWNSASQV